MAASDRNHRTLWLGRAQQGAARPDQLRALGWTPSEIRTRITRGEWHRRHTGVLILGDPGLLPRVEEAAALLALGKRAVLSHRTASVLWGLADPPDERLVHVSLVARSARPRDGIRIHLVQSLDAKDVRRRHNLRLTSPARTVIDLATDAASSELEHVTSEAVAKRLMADAELDQALTRAPANHPGAARLRARLNHDPEFLLHTRSVAERIAYPLILRAGLPRPALNEWVHGELVDLHWPQHKVIVEVDSFQWHGSRQAFENDRRRDQVLTALGYIVIRVTWLQLTREPYRVIATLARALALAGPGLRAA